MMKSTISVIATLMLVACANDEYLGGNLEGVTQNTTISFDGGTGKTSRASMLTGQEAANKLNRNFVVFGTKTTGTAPSATTATVYDHYNVAYTDGTAHTTTSNSAGWEYVNLAPNVLNAPLNGTTLTQDIKYWDFAADQYDFIAFSTGEAEQQPVTGTPGTPGYPGTPASGSVIVTPVDKAHLSDAAYTLTGATTDLTKCYIADRVTATKTAATLPGVRYPYLAPIQFAFHPLAATVRIGLYETIPGYSVTDVHFYQQPISATAEATPYLYAGTQTIPTGKGIVEVSFPVTDATLPAYNRATTKYSPEGEKSQTLTLGALTVGGTAEGKETFGSTYLGRSSSDASMTTDVTVIPASATDLTLKMDFTLVSIDYNETIHIKGAAAVIPAAYTDWQPGVAYTYLFKLSDAVTDIFGRLLYPITFDALETYDDDGVQQTITTIDQPSITTYAKGELGNDYFVGDNIYVAVTNGTPKVLTDSNSKLYTVTLSGTALQSDITEKNITENIDHIRAGEHAIHFTDATSALTFTNVIDAKDSSTGDKVIATANFFARFTAGNETYVFEYAESDPVYYQTVEEYNTDKSTTLDQAAFDALPQADKIKIPGGTKHYKVIRVGNAQRPLTLPDIPEQDI